MKKKPVNKIKTKSLLQKYRLVILDETSFEERFSVMLSRFNVFLAVGSTAVFLIVGTILLIAYTSLREYVPGYASTDLRRTAIKLEFKTDSLINQVSRQELYIKRLKSVLIGDLDFDPMGSADSTLGLFSNSSTSSTLSPSPEELSLRLAVEKSEGLLTTKTPADANFQIPLTGLLVLNQNISRRHFGVSIQGYAGQSVLSMKDGTILSVEGTPSLGYVVFVQHKNSSLSSYSGLSSSFKRPGDFVEKASALGALSEAPENEIPSGHFEYWVNGESLDLQKLLGL
tara:strand:- start:6096 stop:6950 length:855 start_codon:yes stop_codon:yes gene_type:complete